MTKLEQALQAAYLAGFMASGEGYNGEVPFGIRHSPIEDKQLIATAKQKLEKKTDGKTYYATCKYNYQTI